MTEQQDFMKMAENARRAQEAINALGAGPFRAGTPDGLYDAHGFPIPAVQAFPGAPLVGIGGPLGSGKDALADYLVENHGYQKTFMSEPLHEALATINPWIVFEQDPQHDGIVYPTRYVDLVELVGYTEAKRTPEVRRLLQALGTEVGRNMMGETVWTDMAQKKIRSWRSKGLPVVITGIRFPNELEMIREMGACPSGYTAHRTSTPWSTEPSMATAARRACRGRTSTSPCTTPAAWTTWRCAQPSWQPTSVSSPTSWRPDFSLT